MLKRLVILVPLLVVAPVAINALPPGVSSVKVAPAPGETGEVKGLELSARVVSKPGRTVVVAVRAKNPLDCAVATRVKVRVMHQPPSHPMSRMVSLPRERAAEVIHVALKPGQTLERRLRFASVRVPRKPRRAGKGNLRGPMAMSPARVFAQVDPVAPADRAAEPPAQARAATPAPRQAL